MDDADHRRRATAAGRAHVRALCRLDDGAAVALRARLSDVLEACLDERRQAWELQDDHWERDLDAPGPGLHAALLARSPSRVESTGPASRP